MKIYGDSKSGNCYKLQLACALLDIKYEWVDVDILKGETTTSEFLTMNPNGKIPFLALDNGKFLSESNAILNYLARNSSLLPTDEFLLAQTQQWQFFEQYSHEPYIAVARFIVKYLGLPVERREEYEAKLKGGYKALDILEQHLSKSPYLVGQFLSVADISLYAYTNVAVEGGFDMSQYSAVNRWLTRVSSQPKYLPMDSFN